MAGRSIFDTFPDTTGLDPVSKFAASIHAVCQRAAPRGRAVERQQALASRSSGRTRSRVNDRQGLIRILRKPETSKKTEPSVCPPRRSTLLSVAACTSTSSVHAPHSPRPEQTVVGTKWALQCGGKGGNQAVMAARAGARVAMIGGSDGRFWRPFAEPPRRRRRRLPGGPRRPVHRFRHQRGDPSRRRRLWPRRDASRAQTSTWTRRRRRAMEEPSAAQSARLLPTRSRSPPISAPPARRMRTARS